MQNLLTRYIRYLWVALALVAVGIIALLVYLFAVPRDPAPALPSAVTRNIRTIYQAGVTNGNRPDVFSKVGDSITASSSFLNPLGDGTYDLGTYSELQPVIEYYNDAQLRTGNPFTNQSLAAGVGWSAMTVLNPDNAKADACEVGETPLECEYRYSQPTVALIMFGSNDVTFRTVEEYTADMQQIIDISVANGVIPVISTIPHQDAYADKIDAFNAALRQLAADNNLPLWDYGTASRSLPDAGLSADGLHPSAPPWDQTQGAGEFTAESLQYGYTTRNLTALQTLADVRAALPG